MAADPKDNPTELIPGSDIEMDVRNDEVEPWPTSGFAQYMNAGMNALPKTDWSRDGIIASDD